ncbi:MAG: RNA polymerase recycling motor ATPase HelR [Nakamurella sp.]
MTRSTSAFALPQHLQHKQTERLTDRDEQQFALVRSTIATSITETTDQLALQRRMFGRSGAEAVERDSQIHRLTARLRSLHRYGIDLCLGRMVRTDDPEPVYLGRLGLWGTSGDPLLIDWRSPEAEPFFAATHADPRGLSARRRYRWSDGQVVDFWDEVFTQEGLLEGVALDDQSAFIAGLGGARSGRMRDVVGTIQADQDAIIRASSEGALVVDGGPGTGKTVVALHRTAQLLYADPRLGHRRGGVLFIGPHRPYLAYVSDVLPSLGEEGVVTCLLRDLVPEGQDAVQEPDAAVAALKASAELVGAIDAAVRFHEDPPTDPLTVSTTWADVTVRVRDWAEAFATPDAGTPHNEARMVILDALVQALTDRADVAGDAGPLADALRRNKDLNVALNRAWPVIGADDVVGDLWSVPAYLRLAAPWLTLQEVNLLQRAEPQAWTDADLPLLDAARQRLGDPGAERAAARERAAVEGRRREMVAVVDDLIANDDSELKLMSSLRQSDLQDLLAAGGVDYALPDPDRLAGTFAHVVVDEAQELTDAQWQMVLSRCPSRSVTIVGDRAQSAAGFPESWAERLQRVGFDRVRLAALSINYRTPQEVMDEAEPVIRAVLPDANVPTSIRSTGIPVHHGHRSELPEILAHWEATDRDGIACVIGDPTHSRTRRVQSLTPETAKGLEFDLVVLIDPERFGDGIAGGVNRYVAMTRATQRLVVLTG